MRHLLKPLESGHMLAGFEVLMSVRKETTRRHCLDEAVPLSKQRHISLPIPAAAPQSPLAVGIPPPGVPSPRAAESLVTRHFRVFQPERCHSPEFSQVAAPPPSSRFSIFLVRITSMEPTLVTLATRGIEIKSGCSLIATNSFVENAGCLSRQIAVI
ncbi:hypothetical protein KR51_00013450 [Rubidibacter lacunae KORDI 51-2]|uniref:Uncharacterized protein n=1 Tax=Rubidibacter lacunae KORDI 51-2 TaxID=582515 RepID=U5DJZ8_9CHRO|nr:hypothetical protein KR51_00013450 [Rubidibacter lacunae KORDI 51-2]